jgi:C1A family cysteine protease
LIENHNKGNRGFRLAENLHADMDFEEFLATRTGNKYEKNTERSNKNYDPVPLDPTVNVSSFPAHFDWRLKGAVTPIKDQGYCGSCYAFGALVAVEGQLFKATGELMSLSEQQIVDCTTPDWDGCEGNADYNVLLYIVKNGGISSAKDYPYQAQVVSVFK